MTTTKPTTLFHLVCDGGGEVEFSLHVETDFWWSWVGEKGRVANNPGGERGLGQFLYLLFADATSTSKQTKADESVSIALPNAGASM